MINRSTDTEGVMRAYIGAIILCAVMGVVGAVIAQILPAAGAVLIVCAVALFVSIRALDSHRMKLERDASERETLEVEAKVEVVRAEAQRMLHGGTPAPSRPLELAAGPEPEPQLVQVEQGINRHRWELQDPEPASVDPLPATMRAFAVVLMRGAKPTRANLAPLGVGGDEHNRAKRVLTDAGFMANTPQGAESEWSRATLENAQANASRIEQWAEHMQRIRARARVGA